MRFKWRPHAIVPNMSHTHYNGHSILWSKAPMRHNMLGGAQFEIMPYDEDDIIRFNSRKAMEAWLQEHST